MRSKRRIEPLVFLTVVLATAAAVAQAPAEAPPPAPRAYGSPAPAVAPTPPPNATAPPVLAPPRMARAPRAAMPALAGRPRAFEGGFLGVELVDLTPELREHFGVPREAGVMIARVEPSSPASRAGLAVGDIVVDIAGRSTHDSWELSNAVLEGDHEAPVDVAYFRDGKRKATSVKLERRHRDGFEVGGLLAPRAGTPFPDAPMALAPAIDHLRGMMEAPEFGERLREMQSQVDREVAAKMKDLERRLEELEEKLQRNER